MCWTQRYQKPFWTSNGFKSHIHLKQHRFRNKARKGQAYAD